VKRLKVARVDFEESCRAADLRLPRTQRETGHSRISISHYVELVGEDRDKCEDSKSFAGGSGGSR
jgi:hypothetical protein